MSHSKKESGGKSSHLSKFNPIPYLLTKSTSSTKESKNGLDKFATIGDKNSSLKAIGMDSRSTLNGNSPFLDQKKDYSTVKINPFLAAESHDSNNNSLNRSYTLNSRSMSKVKSLNNLKQEVGDLSKNHSLNAVKKDKIRPIKSSFLKNSTNTFSNMFPKMDFFSKSNSYKEETMIARSISENIKNEEEETAKAELIARSTSEQIFTEEPCDEYEDEEPSISYLNDNSAYEWINQALTQDSDIYSTKQVFVYGALFSEVSYYFYEYLFHQSQNTWPKLFSGSEAIDTICKIIDQTDRRLALLIGRSLEAQGFIYHTNHEAKLTDSTYEIYQLDIKLENKNLNEAKAVLPNGVFTLLTECYSPTCTDDNKCYSISCPRKVNHLGMTIHDNHDHNQTSDKKKEKLWENFVEPEIVASVSDKERKRQEIIFELVYTELDFVSDLKVIQEVYLMPIHCEDIIEDEEQRSSFIEEVFLNVLEIQKASFELSMALKELQEQQPVIVSIGRLFLDYLKCFEPFKEYGANQVYAKRRLARDIKSNTALDEFLKEQTKHPECRKLPIQSFLARPTTRLGRYPLLLEAILKYTEIENEDQVNLPKVIQGIKDILSEINIRAGKADNRVKLEDLHSHLIGNQEIIDELNLLHESRILIREGVFKKKFGVENGDLHCFLLDHYFLMTKKRKSSKKEDGFEYKISKKPIRLDLLHLPDHLETPQNRTQATNTLSLPLEQGKSNFQIILTHLGKQGSSYTLLCSTQTEKDGWKNIILEQRNKILLKNMVFKPVLLANPTNCSAPTINCSAVYETNCTLLIGSDDGIYSKHVDQDSFELLINTKFVNQVEVLEDCDLLLVLAERILYYITLTSLYGSDDKKELVKIKTNIDFFSVGLCLERTLICAVKSTALSTTFKIYQPTNSIPKKGANVPKSFFSTFSTSSSQLVAFFKEFYIPSEAFNVYFLKSKICVACTRGFEVLDFNLNPQSLLDPSDENLNFVINRGETVKPIAFYRIKDGSFFVCFDEFGFHIDRAGKLDTNGQVINWYGAPKSFALCYPFLMAFSNCFIEVWNLENFQLEQTILSNSIKALRTKSDAIHYLENHDTYQLNGLLLNKTNPSYLAFRKGLRSQRVNKRRGIVGKDAL